MKGINSAIIVSKAVSEAPGIYYNLMYNEKMDTVWCDILTIGKGAKVYEGNDNTSLMTGKLTLTKRLIESHVRRYYSMKNRGVIK